ncbi:iron ABC transporter permease [bacterium]|nr:iron ABC transporter permease [bacterium]MBU4560997.1 iron ABC transporter permease [bacterium]MCG2677198.1 iron ABC transporter permease [bacterium]
MREKLIRWIIWILILGGILLGVSIFSLCVGSAGIPVKKIVSLILEGRGTTEYSILFDIRLPRIILGFAIGGALSLAGVILQGMFRNPLVEPYTLGISGGAALGVCLNIVFRLNKALGILSLPLCGFLGALLVILLVYSLSMRKGILKIQGLLLTGVMISFISSSLIMLIMAISRTEDLHGIVFWIMGSLEEPNWFLIKIALLVSILGLVISYLFSIDLNAFALGEEEALHLGVNTERTKKILFILASLLTGCSVSMAGIIGFVGLVVPHFVRMFVGGDHRILLVSSFLCGASFLIFCDTLARTVISPMELPVGVITGILGGSLFVYALTKRQVLLGEK